MKFGSVEEGQCSRCLYIQYVDTSESCAFKCSKCDEVDAGYFDDDIIRTFDIWI
jgi:hypothetical protein